MPQRPYTRSRTYRLPPSTDDWIPATHPVRFIAQLVEELPAAEVAALGIGSAPSARGAPRYAPELLLSVWLAGFMLGVRTTRKLEYACQYDLAFIWLAGGQHPATIPCGPSMPSTGRRCVTCSRTRCTWPLRPICSI